MYVIFCVLLQAGLLSPIAVPDDLLSRLSEASRRFDRMALDTYTTVQLLLRPGDAEKGEPPAVFYSDIQEPLPPPLVQRHRKWLVDNDRFHMTADYSDSGGANRTEVWVHDGSGAYLGRASDGNEVFSDREMREPSGRLRDVRALAFRDAKNRSRLAILEQAAREGTLEMSQRREQDKDLIVVQAAYTAENGRDRKLVMWLDPEKDYLPVYIEEHSGGHLRYRYTDIQHARVNGTTWFPVHGVLQQVETRDGNNYGRVRATVTLDVDPSTVDLAPAITEDSFKMSLPPGTVVHDQVLRESFVVMNESKSSPDHMIKVVEEASTENATSSPATSGAAPALADRGPGQEDSPDDLYADHRARSSRGYSTSRWALGLILLFVAGALASWALRRNRRKAQTP